jgi:hypothetical protein
MAEHHHAYGSGACPHHDCVRKSEPLISRAVFAFGRNPMTDVDLDHHLDVYTPLGIVSTFEAAQAGLIKYFRYYNNIGQEGEDNLELDDDEQEERDEELSDDADELTEFTKLVEGMTFVGSTDGDCAVVEDDHGDYYWIQSYVVDTLPEWEHE